MVAVGRIQTAFVKLAAVRGLSGEDAFLKKGKWVKKNGVGYLWCDVPLVNG